MKAGLRQSMAWLHTWSGLLLGWLLLAMFVTGTSAYFREEISLWMAPELHHSQPSPDTPALAWAALNVKAPDAKSWDIQLPEARSPVVQLRWQPDTPQAEDGGRRRGEQAVMDAGTGELLTPRASRGGDFLYRFHFELYGVPRIWARWLICVATMFMLVAIVSGVITHKKIFKDFFTFRPGKGQRSWLDSHNATAVLALPALIAHQVDAARFAGSLFHLFSGGAMLGAFFIATDPVSAATSRLGRFIYALLIGLLIWVIRTFGGYPDAVAFAVLLLNLSAPFIDYYTQPRAYGHRKANKGANP